MNVQKFYETLARILSVREGCRVTVTVTRVEDAKQA